MAGVSGVGPSIRDGGVGEGRVSHPHSYLTLRRVSSWHPGHEAAEPTVKGVRWLRGDPEQPARTEATAGGEAPVSRSGPQCSCAESKGGLKGEQVRPWSQEWLFDAVRPPLLCAY